MQPPVIVIPGITASTLRDDYNISPEPLWSVMQKRFNRLLLHPDDLRYEAVEPARVSADQLFDFPYKDFIAELQHNLAQHADEPVPVFPFAYDWRMPLAFVQQQLAAFINEVIDRTKLLRHYHRDAYATTPQVDLVAHSMGGLVVAGYLSTSHDKRIRRVATLGAPFRGSFEAVLKIATGTAAIGAVKQNSREREAARLMPSLYHLIPSYADGIITTNPKWKNLFDATSWQPGVIATIAEQIRLNGVQPPKKAADRQNVARKLLHDMLQEAADHRATVEGLRLETIGLTSNDWLSIVGIGEETRTAMKIADRGGAPFFQLDHAERKSGYRPGVEALNGSAAVHPSETGDGTVPFPGACCAFISQEKLVCVCNSDFGYWEIRDRLVEGPVVTLHAVLPAMNMVQKLVVAHLKGRAGSKGKAIPGIHGRRSPDLAAEAAWDPPIEGLEEIVPEHVV